MTTQRNKLIIGVKSGVALALIVILLDLLFPLRIERNYSTAVYSAEDKLIAAFLNNNDKWRFEAEYDELPQYLVKAIIHKEDKYFNYHPGFNPISIIRATIQNIFSAEVISGASTISMQLARLLEPKERTLINKLVETFRAVQLEMHFSKDEILLIYLNHLPYGGNIEGIKAAAALYFEKPPRNLSLSESVAFTIIPNNPNKYFPGKSNSEIEKAKNNWLVRLRNDGVFNNSEVNFALKESISAKRREIPKSAPHLAYRLHNDYPNSSNIHTHIKYELQLKISSAIRSYTLNQNSMGIYNSAVLVIENETGSVIAYAGSNDFFDNENNGQVDGIRALRSPGSTLKPLIYALSFERGLLTPMKRLPDVPITFSDYSPENFTGTYHGMVTARDALAWSLNIPAVRLLYDYGTKKFLLEMIKIGFDDIKNRKKKLGPSVILGGCGTTLEELTRMYSIFANSGKIRDLIFTKQENQSLPDSIISPEAAFLISDILSGAVRPDLLYETESALNIPKIAWKTGTSYGRKDAWSIGYNKAYTVGVWVGNFNGSASEQLTGTGSATPLLFEIFGMLGKRNRDWFDKPDNLYERMIDAHTGLLPGKYTQDTISDYYIPLVSETTVSENYEEFFVDGNTSYCDECNEQNNLVKVLYPKYDPELIAYFKRMNIPFEKPPPHNNKCSRVAKDSEPIIEFPVNGQEYFIEKDAGQKIRLSAITGSDVSMLHWYIDDKFLLGSNPDSTVFFEPEKSGKYKISCNDDKGRNADISIRISFY